MKKIIISIAVLLNSCFINAQPITDTIHFNNYVTPANNDLVNHFTNTSWITMDTIHGITGGALNTPNTLSWGNDLIWYCKNYSNVIDSMLVTSVSFKWNSSLINTSTYDRAAVVFLWGDSINHNVGYYLNRDRTLTVITYGAVQNSLITLTNGNWYRLVASYKSLSTFPADNVYTRAEIFDLGANGLSTPVAVGNTTLMLHDSSLTFSGQFNVRICGAKWGGGEYLDNFTFHGTPGTINCVTTNLNKNYFNSDALTIYPQPANDLMYVSLNQIREEKTIFYFITDMEGRKIMEGKTVSKDLFSIPVKQLSPGIYLLRIQNGAGFISKQIAVN